MSKPQNVEFQYLKRSLLKSLEKIKKGSKIKNQSININPDQDESIEIIYIYINTWILINNDKRIKIIQNEKRRKLVQRILVHTNNKLKVCAHHKS